MRRNTFLQLVMVAAGAFNGMAGAGTLTPTIPKRPHWPPALELQNKGTSIGGKRDVVVPVNGRNARGLFFFSESGVHYVDLSKLPARAFAIEFTIGSRKVGMTGEHFDQNWHQFIPTDLASNKTIHPMAV